jgi:hypothetical protein
MRRGAGAFTASGAVVTAKTDSALIEFFRELNRHPRRAGPADELDRAKRFVALRLPESFETTAKVAGRSPSWSPTGWTLDYYDSYVERDHGRHRGGRAARRAPLRASGPLGGRRRRRPRNHRGRAAGGSPSAPVEVRSVDEFVR